MAVIEKRTTFTFDEVTGTLAPANEVVAPEQLTNVDPLSTAKEQLRRSLKEVISLQFHIDFFPGMNFTPEMKDLLFKKYASDDAMGFLLQWMFSFLEADTIEDYLNGNDDARKQMEDAIYKEFGEMGKSIIENNKLRPNKLSETFEPMGMIVEIVSAYAPTAAADLREAYSLLDPRATTTEERSYVTPAGITAIRQFPIYKTLSRSEKQEVVESYVFATFRMIEVLLSAQLTTEPVDTVTW